MSETSPRITTADWYLFTRRGDIAARITDGLLVGEDREGDVWFNPDPDQAQLVFSLNPNGSLSIRVHTDALELHLPDRVHSRELQIDSTDSVRLRLSHNEIFIHTGLVASSLPAREIKVDLVEVTEHSLQLPEDELILLPEPYSAGAVPDGDPSSGVDHESAKHSDLDALAEASEIRDEEPEPQEQGEAAKSQELTEIFSAETSDATGSQHPTSIPAAEAASFQNDQPASEVPSPRRSVRYRPSHRRRSRSALVLIIVLVACALAIVPMDFGRLIPVRVSGDSEQIPASTPETGTAEPIVVQETGSTPDLESEILKSVAALTEAETLPDNVTIEFILETLATLTETGDTGAARMLEDFTARLADEATGLQQRGDTVRASQLLAFAAATGLAEATVARADAIIHPVEPVVPGASADASVSENSVGPAEDNAEVAELLVEARRLIDGGAIVESSNDSAVAYLTRALRIDPTNQTALDLMWECAETLLMQALAAESEGREFEARNILEEILAFHPEHPRANALWSEWTGSPYARRSTTPGQIGSGRSEQKGSTSPPR